MKSSISRRLPTILSIAFGEAGWRHPEGRFNIEPRMLQLLRSAWGLGRVKTTRGIPVAWSARQKYLLRLARGITLSTIRTRGGGMMGHPSLPAFRGP